jgi:hypothetical protein
VANAADPPGRGPGRKPSSAGDLVAGSFRTTRAWPPALLCALLGLTWQLLTVHFNYVGNFTALFCTASTLPIPPQLAAEHIYVFPQGGGYDGQYYHYVAHDPLFQTAIGHSIPSPALRYPRILLPGLAYLLALGHQPWIDASYIACNLAFLVLGAWWLAQLLARIGSNPWFAVLYLLVPATLISLDRMVTDLALTSLCLGFAVYLKSATRWKLLIVVSLAALCRDTGFFLAIACCIQACRMQNTMPRRFRACLPFLAALIPAVLWYIYVGAHVPLEPMQLPIPFRGLLGIAFRATPYPFPAPLPAAIASLDWLELAGLFLAIGIGIGGWRKAASDPLAAACVLWSITGLMLPPQEVYSAARILSPLMLYQFLESYRSGRLLGRIPMAMVTPRILLQLTPQAAGVAHALVRAAFTLV